MGKHLSGILIVLLVGFLFFHMTYSILYNIGWLKHDNVEAVSRHAPEQIISKENTSVFSMSATQLTKEYSENEVAADDKYKGKTIAVYGNIESVETGLFGTMIDVNLKDERPLGWIAVTCHFNKSHKAELASLSKGQRVSIIGQCDGKAGSVILNACQLR